MKSFTQIIAKIIFIFLIFAFTNSSATVILQYFESQYSTIEKRMPDIFMAGYDGLWIPPTNRADTGNQSVGYDLYDRFDLGTPSSHTLYGTEAYLRGLIYAAHSTDIKIYPDTIFNHCGFRDKNTAGFAGYPGFALTFPSGGDAAYGDFHNYSDGGDQTMRISNLVDIAQENNDSYIRQPTTVDATNNLPGMWVDTTFARFYPDTTSSPGDVKTFSGFNLTHPLKGAPVKENATGLLLRYAQWMNEVMDADGFRLDAAKNMPSWFFSTYLDGRLSGKGRRNRDGSTSNPFTFGEVYDGNASNVYAYANTAVNRDVLDFPLYFPMYTELNANGFGNFKNFIYASVDQADDGNVTNGTVGVQFVDAHDSGIPYPKNYGVGYAYVLTRPGRPIVYFNAQEFGTGRSFPRSGAADYLALGGSKGNQITRLVDISNRYAKGNLSERWVDNKFSASASQYYVYERDSSLIVGLDLREDAGYDEVTVSTYFPTGSVLVELTGNATDTIYNQGGTLYPQVTVDGSGKIPIRIPRSNLLRGYVMYGLRSPNGTLTLTPVNSIIAADDTTVSVGIRRITPIPVITGATVTLTLQTDSTENNAIWKLDDGYTSFVSGDTTPAGTLILSGNNQGFQQVTSGLYVTATKSVGTTGGAGKYVINLPTSKLYEGIHYFTIKAFLERPAGSPNCYSTFKQVFYVDKTGPTVNLVSPTYTGSNDVNSSSATVVIGNPDMTANSMHVFVDWSGAHTVGALQGSASGSNHATWSDRSTFTWTWNGITPGNHTLDILAYEVTGTASVTSYSNINLSGVPVELSYFETVDGTENKK